MRRPLFIVVLLVALTACKGKDENGATSRLPDRKRFSDRTEAKVSVPPAGNSDADDNSGADATSPVTDTVKKIVKDCTIEFETDDVLATHKKILSSLKKYGGYVDEDNQTTNSDSNRREYELKVHIPSKYFDVLLDTASATADKIVSKDISITDSTTHFIDITTRLSNKKILEKRYLELLGKATKVSDMLEIENKLNDIRSDIESTQRQLNYLNKQVAYSSLDITFYAKQDRKDNSGIGFGYQIKKAVARGWQRLQHLFFGLIGLWPYLLLLALAYWLANKWVKRIKARRSADDE